MPSARKMRRQERKRRGHLAFSLKINKKIFIYVSLVFAFALGIFALRVVSQKHFWDGKQKLAVAVRQDDGALILLFDPEYDELVSIHIPEHTQIEVAKELGVWKIESIWELGKQEKVGGKLLADSITKYFKFPVSAWADTQAAGFSTAEAKNLLTAGFSSYDTNLSLGDRVRMAWFSFNTANTHRIDIQLEDTGYLTKTNLSDGGMGYIKVDPPPQRIMTLFADSDISKSSFAVSIQDATGKSQIARNVGQVVEVLGAKIAAVNRQDEKDMDCLVKGNNQILIDRVANLFSCEKEDSNSNFDLEILLGSEFAKRF